MEISARTFSAARLASPRRPKLSEDSATINALAWISRQRQPLASSLKTSNRHMPQHIATRSQHPEIGIYRVLARTL